MSIQIDRFEPIVAERGIEFKIERESGVIIKDHASDKIISMINLEGDPNKNIEIANLIIAAIEEWIVLNED